MTTDSRPSRCLLPLGIVAGLGIALGLALFAYRPDRPVERIEPGSSDGPAFVVQVIRPRIGLPLGGLLPPQVFGLEGHLGFDSESPGASVGSVEMGRLELRAEGWELILVTDDDGRVDPRTRVVFDLVFEGQSRRVRARPGEPPVGTRTTVALDRPGEISGSFDVELAACEDADTGEPLGWPPQPLRLHGSFDRLAGPVRGER